MLQWSVGPAAMDGGGGGSGERGPRKAFGDSLILVQGRRGTTASRGPKTTTRRFNERPPSSLPLPYSSWFHCYRFSFTLKIWQKWVKSKQIVKNFFSTWNDRFQEKQVKPVYITLILNGKKLLGFDFTYFFIIWFFNLLCNRTETGVNHSSMLFHLRKPKTHWVHPVLEQGS